MAVGKWAVRAGRTVLAVLLGAGGAMGQQVVERETVIQGPQGKTIDRRIRIERTPGAVRREAAWALGQIGDPSGRPYLEVASTSDSKRHVREASLRAQDRLDSMALPIESAPNVVVPANPPPAPFSRASSTPSWRSSPGSRGAQEYPHDLRALRHPSRIASL